MMAAALDQAAFLPGCIADSPFSYLLHCFL